MKNIIKKLVIGTTLTAMTFVAAPALSNGNAAYAATKVVTSTSKASNYDFTQGKLCYEITGKNTCTVVGLTKNAANTTSCTIPSSVTCNGKTYKVTNIANKAFANCDSLKSVKISNSVKTIGSKAFYNCDSLKNVSLGNSVNTIKNNAFSGCNNLNKINCSTVIKNLGSNCFGNAFCNISR